MHLDQLGAARSRPQHSENGGTAGGATGPFAASLLGRKRLLGKSSEVVGWLAEGQRAEMQIGYRKGWSHPDEAAEVDERFADLHGQLSVRSIN